MYSTSPSFPEPRHVFGSQEVSRLNDGPFEGANSSRASCGITSSAGTRVDLSSISVSDHYRVMQQWGEGAVSGLLDGRTMSALLNSMDEGLSRAFLPTEWAGRSHLELLLECGWKGQLFFDRAAQPIGGAIFLDRTAIAGDDQPISLRYIGFLYVAPEAQGKGAGRTLVDVLCHLESPDVILADVINPFSICPELSHPAHVDPDPLKRTTIWREHFGQVMDPHGRLAFWTKQGFLSPILEGERGSSRFAPFPPIPLDCKRQPLPPEDGNHSYCCLVRPVSRQGRDLFASSATAQQWESLYRSLYPEDPDIDRTSLAAFSHFLGKRERMLSLADLLELPDRHRLLLDLSRQSYRDS